MKNLITIILLIIAFSTNAMQILPNDDCSQQIIKSSSDKNGVVKKTSGEIVATNETISLRIDPCNYTVTVELNNKVYDLVLYKKDKSGTLYAATINGKQIITININVNTNEVNTTIEDLIYITHISNKKEYSESITVDD